MRIGTLLLLLAPLGLAGDEPVSAFRFKQEPEKVRHGIKLREIRQGVSGADPRDKIRTILKPEHVPAAEATWVKGTSRVLGVVRNGEARAYPLAIMQVHELANDVLGGDPIAPNY